MTSATAAQDLARLGRAVELAALCPPSDTAFSVGCVITGDAGHVLAEGHSRQDDPRQHAEEAALARLAESGAALPDGATLYSSMEPCGRRASRPRPCAELIIAAGIARVVYALDEPPVFVTARGSERLRGAGVEVVVHPELADAARAPNAHLVG